MKGLIIMKETCNIIKDLLPSFVDEICSEDSKNLIYEHIQSCEQCKEFLESMKKPLQSVELSVEKDKLKAQKPFKKINKMHRIRIIIVAIAVMLMTMIGMMVVINVGAINNFLFPHQISVINEEDGFGEWKAISFEGNQYLIYDSIFYKKTVTNNANSTDSIKMRILDKKGNIVLNDLIIDAGTTINLKELENNKYYTVEIWADNGWYMLNFR